MKLFNKANLEKYVSDLTDGEVSIQAFIPALVSYFAFITESEPPSNGEDLNAAVRKAMDDDDFWNMVVPTEEGNGVLIDIKEHMNAKYPIWGISPSGKVLLYAPKKFIKILTLDEFGSYLCKESGVDAVAYAYPDKFEVMFEGIMSTDSPSSPLGQILQTIADEALDKEEINSSSWNLLAQLKDEANAAIWGKNDCFILNSGEVMILPQSFGVLMEHSDLLCDQIIERAQGTDLEDVVTSTVQDIKSVLSHYDLSAMSELEESVQILQEVIPDAETLEAINTLADLFS